MNSTYEDSTQPKTATENKSIPEVGAKKGGSDKFFRTVGKPHDQSFTSNWSCYHGNFPSAND